MVLNGAPEGASWTIADGRIAMADLLVEQGQAEAAIELYGEVVAEDPGCLDAGRRMGLVLGAPDRPADARRAFARALAMRPDDIELHLDLARAALAAGELTAAEAAFRQALERQPDLDEAALGVAETLNLAALACLRAGQAAEARRRVLPVTESRPDLAAAWETLGLAAMDMGDGAEATRALETALGLDPDMLAATLGLARRYKALGNLEGASALLERLAERLPDSGDIQCELAHVYERRGLWEPALALLDACLQWNPADVAACNISAMCHAQAGRQAESMAAARMALKLSPENAVATILLARAEMIIGDRNRVAVLLASIAEAIREDIELALAAAQLYEQLREQDKAMVLLQRVLELDPGNRLATSRLLDITLSLCDWRNYDGFVGGLTEGIVEDIAAGRPIAIDIFNLQALPLDYAAIARAARNSAATTAKAEPVPTPRPARPGDGRIRLGYLLPYTWLHSLPLVLKDIVEAHPRDRFEVLGYCTEPCDGGPFSRDYRAVFDRFRTLPPANPTEAAAMVAEDGLDLLIDVAGLTGINCMSILAERPAPIQAHAFGYSITTGADYVDYLVSDPIYITPEDAAVGPEALVYLPETFMPTVRAPVAPDRPRRLTLGLPEDALVLANFNHPCKFEPVMFEVWMRLLADLPEAVLWLGDWLPLTQANLRREAESRGVDPDRLVFAGIVEHDQHLARLAVADLAIDNLRHGGGITTVDALWVGLPVVTPRGSTPSARLGATLLDAAGVAELITTSLEDYARLILDLPRDPARREELRSRLLVARDAAPLFDTARFRGHLETGYEMMVARHRRGLAPATIEVPAAPR